MGKAVLSIFFIDKCEGVIYSHMGDQMDVAGK